MGKSLARIFGVEFTDFDDLIVARSGISIPDIFASQGESVFRDYESDLVQDLSRFRGVIATGGGVVERKRNRERLKRECCVFLDPPWENILDRIQGSDRPLIQGNSLEWLNQLYLRRHHLYSETAQLRFTATDAESLARLLDEKKAPPE